VPDEIEGGDVNASLRRGVQNLEAVLLWNVTGAPAPVRNPRIWQPGFLGEGGSPAESVGNELCLIEAFRHGGFRRKFMCVAGRLRLKPPFATRRFNVSSIPLL
jgi:hypothetical protein